MLPELTRVLRYNDTPDEDWIISRHPEDPSVILTTGGSGHAFKVLISGLYKIYKPVLPEVITSSCQSLDGLLLTSSKISSKKN